MYFPCVLLDKALFPQAGEKQAIAQSSLCLVVARDLAFPLGQTLSSLLEILTEILTLQELTASGGRHQASRQTRLRVTYSVKQEYLGWYLLKQWEGRTEDFLEEVTLV